MTIAELASGVLGCEVSGVRRLHGGDLAGVWRLELADGRMAVAKQGPLVAREAAMLRAIAATGTPAPAVIACDGDLLIMEWIESDGGLSHAWDDLAAMLARLHGNRASQYGWHEDYAFGPVRIDNATCSDWPVFWAKRRLLPFVPHLPPSLARRVEALAIAMPEYLPHSPAPALLHGDLWGGNVLARGGRIAGLIDPACYYGDREVDVAMLTLFDHPPARFFDTLALDSGWRERLPAYRLWPLLVHYRLFGDSYRSGVEGALDALGQ
ncbi:fructosamine kinase family protein [Croceicoccus sp. Ery5]|uniref:fructosamine kinase family protein n=1 Tax=Croceicoccus sp. Ery5 TaxID=1703340 RepID=UPI001E3C44A8|nr:fructosamine kinase family protein [Croceicoccus sp. Ery5]